MMVGSKPQKLDFRPKTCPILSISRASHGGVVYEEPEEVRFFRNK